MRLECDKAEAIKTFLDAIGYRKWCVGLRTVTAKGEKRSEDCHLGTENFEELAEAIGYISTTNRNRTPAPTSGSPERK